MIFEMNGQLGNCIVEEETCADCCSECAAGSGKCHWNYAMLRRVISLFVLFVLTARLNALPILCYRQYFALGSNS